MKRYKFIWKFQAPTFGEGKEELDAFLRAGYHADDLNDLEKIEEVTT